MDATVLGLLQVLGMSLVPAALLGVALHAGALVEHCRSLGQRVGMLPPQAPAPTRPPLQRLAADLRRLRPEAMSPRPGIAMARRRGVVAAYDDLLVSTAEALDVPTTLDQLDGALDREAERLRLEHALERAGLSWQVRER